MKSIEELKKIRESAKRNIDMRSSKNGYRILVGMATCGIASGAKPVMAKFVEEVARKNLENVVVTQVGCIGKCAYEPIVEVVDSEGRKTIYANVTEEKVVEIVNSHIENNTVVDEYKLSNN